MKITKFLKDEKGATAVEYAIMASLIAAVIIVIVALLGGQVSVLFNSVSSQSW